MAIMTTMTTYPTMSTTWTTETDYDNENVYEDEDDLNDYDDGDDDDDDDAYDFNEDELRSRVGSRSLNGQSPAMTRAITRISDLRSRISALCSRLSVASHFALCSQLLALGFSAGPP